MNLALSLALLVAGIILLIFGLHASDAFSSQVTRAVSGHPTDRAMWLIVGGAAVTILGLVGLFRSRPT